MSQRVSIPIPENAGTGTSDLPTSVPGARSTALILLFSSFCIAEFDKFLEERAKAAEMVPNLPSPPLEAPTPPTNPSSRKKQERSEDALFAL